MTDRGWRQRTHWDAAEVEAADELTLRLTADRVLDVQCPLEPVSQRYWQRVPAIVATIDSRVKCS